jgi:hypothetical protein
MTSLGPLSPVAEEERTSSKKEYSYTDANADTDADGGGA